MIRTKVHQPHSIKACQVNDSLWIEALDQEGCGTTACGGEISIFLSRDQARKLRDEFAAMDLGEDADGDE